MKVSNGKRSSGGTCWVWSFDAFSSTHSTGQRIKSNVLLYKGSAESHDKFIPQIHRSEFKADLYTW